MSVGQVAMERKKGQLQAEAQAKLPGVANDTENSIARIDELLKHPGLSQSVGVLLGRLPAVTGPALDFQERLKQVSSAAWTNAVQTMRGLGALSNAEGARLVELNARLGRAKTEADFRTALRDAGESMKKAYLVAKRVAAGQMAAPYEPSGPLAGGGGESSGGGGGGTMRPLGSFLSE